MTCRVIMPGVIVCSRMAKKCRCGRPHTKLCDYPLRSEKASKTCDEPLCDKCATRVGPNKDYCPAHARATKGTP